MKRVILILAFATLVGAFSSAPTHAVTLPKVTFDHLVINSPVVLIGTVFGQHFRSLGDANLPYTVYSLRVQEVVYGRQHLSEDLRKEIELPFLGGLDAKGRITTIAGTTRLEMGETYLLFLRGGKWSLNPVSGWDQGAFRLVSAGPDIGHVVLSLSGKALMDVRDDQIILRAPDFNRTRRDDRRPEGKRGSGVKLDRDTLSEPQRGLSDQEELEMEKERLSKQEQATVEPEQHMKMDRSEQLEKWLGGQPMPLKAFVEVVKERRTKLADQIPKDKLDFTFQPATPTGKGMAPPETTSADH